MSVLSNVSSDSEAVMAFRGRANYAELIGRISWISGRWAALR